MADSDSKQVLVNALGRVCSLGEGPERESPNANDERYHQIAVQFGIALAACGGIDNPALARSVLYFEPLTRNVGVSREQRESLRLELDLFIAQLVNMSMAELSVTNHK